MVVDVNEGNSSTVQRRSAGNKLEVTESGLEWILSFPPLLQAFERFCVKALCIEVRQIYICCSFCLPLPDKLLSIEERPLCTPAIEHSK